MTDQTGQTKQAEQTPRLIHLAEVDSTNSWAKAHLTELGHLDAMYADSQTAGRGRLGRGWANAGADGLYYTIACKTPLADPASLPLLASLAAEKAVRETFGLACQIKWPNDLLAGGKKLCGILCESTPEGIVCGIGVNLWQGEAHFAAQNLPYATSVALALRGQAGGVGQTGQAAAGHLAGQQTTAGEIAGQDGQAGQIAEDRRVGQAGGGLFSDPAQRAGAARALAGRISANFAALLPGFASGGFAAVRDGYKARCVNLGRPVEFAGGSGVAVDIDPSGRLVVDTATGETAVFTGEVSVRGIYGRV